MMLPRRNFRPSRFHSTNKDVTLSNESRLWSILIPSLSRKDSRRLSMRWIKRARLRDEYMDINLKR
jgi:hypothetical protein